MLENDVLPRPVVWPLPLRMSSFGGSDVVGGQQDNGESHTRKGLEFLDDGLPLVWLLVKDNRFEIELFDKAGDRLFCKLVVTVNHEDFVGPRVLRLFRDGDGMRHAWLLGYQVQPTLD